MESESVNQSMTNTTDETAVSRKSTRKKSKVKAMKKNLKIYSCEICQQNLSSPAHLQKHINTKHQPPKDFICDFEGKHFNTKDKLRLHVFQHRLYYKVSCTVCFKEYKTNQSMRKHLRTHFEHHQCDACGHTFKHKRLLQNHISAIHQEYPTIPCNYCTRLFPNKTTRDAHQKNIHQDQQVNTSFFKCSDCPLGFEMKEELRIHSFIHFDGLIHTCLDCNQIFKKKKLLNNHMKKHDVATFQCLSCKQMFKYRSNLGKHQKEGRCKGPVTDVKLVFPSPEEEAELAKQQLIAMTVNPTRVCISTVKDYNLTKIKNEEDHEKHDYAIFQSFIKIDDFKEENECDENPLEDQKNFEPEINLATMTVKKEIVKKTQPKRLNLRKKPTLITRKPISSSYDCDFCEFTTDKKNKILSHIRHHASSMRHKCKTCSELFTTRMNLHNHSMKRHGRGVIGSVEYSKSSSECTICHRLFSEERLKFHKKLHDSPSFTCDKCAKRFRSQSALEKHFANNHLSDKKFTCTTCGKSFKKLTILKQHEDIHNPIKIYVQCEICNTMMQVKSLKLHMEIKHGDRYAEKSHVCACGKAFRYPKQYEKHYEAVHQKVNRGIIYPCSDCDLSFNRRNELREHSFQHFSGKIFECDCGMRFKKQKLLTIHLTVHKKNRWPCDGCTLTFQTRGGRRKHQAKIHGQVVEEVVEIPSYDCQIAL